MNWESGKKHSLKSRPGLEHTKVFGLLAEREGEQSQNYLVPMCKVCHMST